MPFTSSSSVVSSRSRRVREKDRDNRPNCATARRSKEHSQVASDRVSPPEPQVSQLSIYSIPNATLEQLPPLPSSGATSPSSSTSPVLRCNKPYLKQTTARRLPQTFHTPAALQPYLQNDDHDDDENDEEDHPAGPTVSESRISELPPAITQLRGRRPSHPSSEPESTPEPGSSGQAVLDLTVSCPALPTATRHDTVASQPQASPSTYKPALHPTESQYSPATHSVSPQLNTQYLYPNNQFYAPRYPTISQLAMPQPNTRVGGYYQVPAQTMPYYPGYGYPNRHPIPFGVMGNPNYQQQTQGIPNQGFLRPPRMEGGNSEQSMDDGFQGSLEEEDEASELVTRIQSAIPDLHLLVRRYRAASSQLGIQENLIHEKELQASETLRQTKAHIDRLMKEMESQAQSHSTETSKLRLEIGNLEDKHRELADAVMTSEKSRAELEVACEALKAQLEESLTLKERAMNVDADVQTSTEEVIDSKVSAIGIVHRREVASLQAKWLGEKMELEAHHSRTIRELEAALDSCRLELENARQREQEGEEKWERERQALQQELEDHKKSLHEEWDEERKCLLKRHEKNIEELRKSRRTPRRDSYDRVEEENERLRQQVEALKMGWDADRTKLSKAKAVAAKLEDENERQRKMIEAFGEATLDLKSRGDIFFKEAFQELHKEIRDVAHKYCEGGLSQPLPNHILSKVPVDLPDFTSDTAASIALLADYVQHTIFSILNNRIFQPFIFTLSSRHEPVNEYFNDVSHQLRRKSTRREAHWRQHTLYAVYTAPNAKRAVNKAVADITKDICDEIRYLISFEDEEQVYAVVRRIVKIAAETWRYARLEKDVITASMSPAQYPTFFETDQNSSGDATASKSSTEYILPILPVIVREAKRRDGRSSSHDRGASCIYLNGAALSKTSPAVLARRAEILIASAQRMSPSDVRKAVSADSQQAMLGEEVEGACHGEASTPVPDQGPRVTDQYQVFGSPDNRDSQSQSDVRSEWSSQNHRRSSTATSATEAGVPDWGGSSGVIPLIQNLWSN